MKDKVDVIPSYTITLPDSLALQYQLSNDNAFMFSLAPTQYLLPPLSSEIRQDLHEKPLAKENQIAPFVLSIEISFRDSSQCCIKLPLSDFAHVPPVLRSKYTKFKDESIEYFSDPEITYQTFKIP